MQKIVKAFLFVLALLTISYQPDNAYAGTTQLETGRVFNGDFSVPADTDISFTAYIVGWEGVQTESSAGAIYEEGWYLINIGNFPHAWSIGETLHIDFVNVATNETSSVDIVLLDAGHTPESQKAYGDEYAPVDVVLSYGVCLVAISVQGSPYGGIGASGEKVTIEVNPSNRVAGVSFNLAYDPALLSATHAALAPETEGWEISADFSQAGEISVNMSNPTQTPLPADNHLPLLNIFFDVSQSAAPGSSSNLTFINHSIISDVGTQMNSCAQEGSFHICRKGDAQADDLVDITDIILILRASLLLDPVQGTDALCRLDVNGDGEVNILDALRALRIVLGLQ